MTDSVRLARNELAPLHKEAENTAEALEQFVEGASLIDPELSRVAPDYPNLYWRTTDEPPKQYEKYALMKGIVDAMPDQDMISHVYEVFVTRCQGPLGNIIHKPTFLAQTRTLYECLNHTSLEKRATALLSSVTMDMLACQLLAVRSITIADIKCVCSHMKTACSRSRLPSYPETTGMVSYRSQSTC